MNDYVTLSGNYIRVFINKKYNYLSDLVLKYYDIQEYDGVLFYCDNSNFNSYILEADDKIVWYNIEHLSSYCKSDKFEQAMNKLIQENRLAEFWDFDLSNYRYIITTYPQLFEYYRFKPLRYVKYRKVDNLDKKYDAIQIGVLGTWCPYRNSVVHHFSKDIDTEFSMLTIDRSKYSLSELYDEINSAKTVLNVPRIYGVGQEQLRIAQLICMNSTVVTQTFKISYLSDYVYEVDFLKDDILPTIKSFKTLNNVAEIFKNDTEEDNNYNKYTNRCYDKWYKTDTSYIFSIIIPAFHKKQLKLTLDSIKENVIFDKIHITVLDNSENEEIKEYCKSEYNNVNVISKKYGESLADMYNKAISCEQGKYVYFAEPGMLICPLFFDKALKEFENNNDKDILIFKYLKNNYIFNLLFEELNIGPMLHCVVFKRNIINIKMQDVECAKIIFSGILCKHNAYKQINTTYYDLTTCVDLDKSDEDSYIFSNNTIGNGINWVEFTKNKINEY